VTDFKFQAVTLFRSKFPVSRSKAHQKHNRSATAWVLFTLQTRQTLKNIRTHPTIAQELSKQECRMIVHRVLYRRNTYLQTFQHIQGGLVHTH
jgi:hypothetical protein